MGRHIIECILDSKEFQEAYAKALAGHFLPADDGVCRPPKCVVLSDDFDWQGDRVLVFDNDGAAGRVSMRDRFSRIC